MTKQEWIKLESKIDQTEEDEFKADFGGLELLTKKINTMTKEEINTLIKSKTHSKSTGWNYPVIQVKDVEEIIAKIFLQPDVIGSLPSEEYELERLYDWVTSEKRELAQTKFTSSKTRDIASEIEYRLKGNDL